MDRETFPIPEFTRAELKYLQTLLDGEKRGWFNWKMELINDNRDPSDADRRYHLAASLRDKVYHLGGRDTLALSEGYDEQRWWDQKHDY